MLRINLRTLPVGPRPCQNIGDSMATPNLLTIGTRASPLAIAQTEEAAARLASTDPRLAAPDALLITKIQTTGDQIQDRHLAELGGKGLFAKELDSALLDGRIDLAVHSLKDLETRLPVGVKLAACLEREDPRDTLIGAGLKGLDSLPKGARVGTASLRRQAQVLHRRPDVHITLLRGNIHTRIRKIREGKADATFLALAGINRMGIGHLAACVLSPDELLPACGQGAIGITCRTNDTRVRTWLERINHDETMIRVSAERAMLSELDGTCRTPIGGLAELDRQGVLTLRGLVAHPDGSALFRDQVTGAADDALALGYTLGAQLRRDAGDDLFK